MNIDDIIVDKEIQSRASVSHQVIEEYAEAIKSGASFPSVTVFKSDIGYLLADGFHRVEAFKLAGKKEIPAEVRSGSKRDAILFALGANAFHGIRRTRLDLRKSIITILNDPEWRKWSNKEIAKTMHCSREGVAIIRREIMPREEDQMQRIIIRKGVPIKMDVTKIAKANQKRFSKDPLDTIEHIQEHSSEDKESNTLYHIKRLWRRASLRDRNNFLKWLKTLQKK